MFGFQKTRKTSLTEKENGKEKGKKKKQVVNISGRKKNLTQADSQQIACQQNGSSFKRDKR